MSLVVRRSACRVLLLSVGALSVFLVALTTTAHAEPSTFHRFEANAIAICRDVTRPCADSTTADSGSADRRTRGRVRGQHRHRRARIPHRVRQRRRLRRRVRQRHRHGRRQVHLVALSAEGERVRHHHHSPPWHHHHRQRVMGGHQPDGGGHNINTFPGSVNRFVGKSRDGVASGTVVFDGRQFVNGSASEAPIETWRTRTSTHRPNLRTGSRGSRICRPALPTHRVRPPRRDASSEDQVAPSPTSNGAFTASPDVLLGGHGDVGQRHLGCAHLGHRAGHVLLLGQPGVEVRRARQA